LLECLLACGVIGFVVVCGVGLVFGIW